MRDECSKAFNGDYYPVGKVIHVSPSYKIITTVEANGTRRKFYRVGRTGGWRQTGGTWMLVAGSIDERNPSF